MSQEELAEEAETPPESPAETWITRPGLAKRWNMPEATLAQWGSGLKRHGPKFAKFGRHVRYRLSDVIRWENEQLGSEPTASEVASGE
jgi:hypothetical protein